MDRGGGGEILRGLGSFLSKRPLRLLGDGVGLREVRAWPEQRGRRRGPSSDGDAVGLKVLAVTWSPGVKRPGSHPHHGTGVGSDSLRKRLQEKMVQCRVLL